MAVAEQGPIAIVLADDHAMFREGLRELLDRQPGLRVLETVADGVAAIEAVERLDPDVVIADIVMPRMTGLEVADRLRRRRPRPRIVILSAHDDDSYVVEALRVGADGYVLKEAWTAELIAAVRAVAAGQRFVGSSLAERSADAGSADREPEAHLSPREWDVLRLVAEGLTSAEIGSRLGISSRTVETHRAAVMRKLRVETPAALIRYAIRHGMLPP